MVEAVDCRPRFPLSWSRPKTSFPTPKYNALNKGEQALRDILVGIKHVDLSSLKLLLCCIVPYFFLICNITLFSSVFKMHFFLVVGLEPELANLGKRPTKKRRCATTCQIFEERRG